MTVLDSTISMLHDFTDEELVKIQNMISVFFVKNHKVNPFRLLTKDDILGELDYSKKLADSGEIYDSDIVCDYLEQKYGL